MTAAELIASKLHASGCHHIFAISGAGNVFLFDAIAQHPHLEYVCPHHEQAGVMAAVAYSRLSEPKRLGVMMTTGGPGAINALTGALNAWADSIPIVIISGQEKSSLVIAGKNLRMWGVQGFDVVRAVGGFTKYAVMITDPNTVGYHLDRAIYEATTGRPGPVWLDIPMDVQSALVIAENQREFVRPQHATVDLSSIASKVHELLTAAHRPVFILGNGIRLAGGESLLPDLLDRFHIPVITAWSGMDMLSSDHPRYYGHAGVYGGRCSNFVVQNADLLVCIGTRLAIPQIGYDFSEYARGAKKVVVDIDPEELKKFNPPVDYPIEADARQFIAALLKQAQARPYLEVAAWLEKCADWKRRYPIIEPEFQVNRPASINTYRFIDELNRHLSPTDVMVADAGAAHTSTQQTIFLQKGQKFIATTGLGEMGYGLPAAVGASFARPGHRIILITGDGSMMMNLQELQTIVHHKLPVKIFLYDNDAYLTIRNTQKALFNGRQAGSGKATGVTCPDFLKVCSAFGIPTYAVSDFAQVPGAIDDCLASLGPAVCVVYSDPHQVFVPKLSLSTNADGSLVSPPLEDLSPLLPRDQLAKEMLVGMHPKSVGLAVEDPVAINR
jgi:acetolactate synthase-1/2/3 large subunit